MFTAKNKIRIRTFSCKCFACPTPVVRTSQVSWRSLKVLLNLQCTHQEYISVYFRLGILQGGTFSFLVPTIAILSQKQWSCEYTAARTTCLYFNYIYSQNFYIFRTNGSRKNYEDYSRMIEVVLIGWTLLCLCVWVWLPKVTIYCFEIGYHWCTAFKMWQFYRYKCSVQLLNVPLMHTRGINAFLIEHQVILYYLQTETTWTSLL